MTSPVTGPRSSDPVDTDRTTIVLAHGSRADESTQAHEALCEALATRLGAPVRPAYLELAEPSLDSVIEELALAGSHGVLVVPHFLAPGNHVQRDVPELIERARSAHPDLDIEVTGHLGDEPGLVDLLGAMIVRSTSHS